MKHLPILLILLVNTLYINAQPLQLDLALQSGISVPLFDYSAKNLQKGCFTLPGFTGSSEVKLLLNDNWSGALLAGIQLNPVDVGLLGYEKVNADPFLEDLYIRSDPYKVIHLMAGPAYKFPLCKSFSIEGQLTAGVFFASTPYQLYKPEYFFTGPPFYEITPAKDISLAYGGSVRLLYQVAPWYQIAITNQFMQSKASFKFNTSVSTRTDVRNISLWNASFGIIIKLFTLQYKNPDSHIMEH